MKLFYRTLGEGKPFVILHGLYGASDNWLTVANYFKHSYKVIIPDIRNHGESPHDDEMDFEVMSEDVLEMLNDLAIDKCILMGHSMGGKLAMKFAFDNPDKIEKLIIVDVASKSYLSGYSKHFEFHKNVVSKMNSMNVQTIQSRGEAERKLMEVAKSEKIVRFLLKNLKREKGNGYAWKLNIKSIHRNLHKLIDGVENDQQSLQFSLPTLFIKGEKSDYITTEDKKQIKSVFTNLKFVEIKDTGHWVHAEKTNEFTKEVLSFID